MVRLRRKTEPEEISASSMSDIAFLLLVFFMVASVFYIKEGLLTTLPKKESSPKLVLKENVFSVKIKGDSVTLSNVDIGDKFYPTIRNFDEELEKLEVPGIKEKYAVVSASDTNVQNMVTVLSAIKNRGFVNISMQKSLR